MDKSSKTAKNIAILLAVTFSHFRNFSAIGWLNFMPHYHHAL